MTKRNARIVLTTLALIGIIGSVIKDGLQAPAIIIDMLAILLIFMTGMYVIERRFGQGKQK